MSAKSPSSMKSYLVADGRAISISAYRNSFPIVAARIRGFRISMKWLSLMTLVIQNSALVLIMRQSRLTSARNPYLTSTAVVLSELIKLIICLFVHMRSNYLAGYGISFKRLGQDIFGRDSQALPMAVPAILYFIQNNLQYIAVSNLDAATFQVSYQFKIITTAIFSVIMLKRALSNQKWYSLALLTAGIALVQFPTSGGAKSNGTGKGQQIGSPVLGFLSVVCACILSGLAGVWFEKVLKGSKASIYLRNIQLSLFSIVPGFIFGVMIYDSQQVMAKGFFNGYDVWTFLAIACQAVGGLIVAAVVKYADNILKGFATSISIILSCVASIYLFDFHVTRLFVGGCMAVLYATHIYGLPDPPEAKKSPIPEALMVELSDLEKGGSTRY